MNAQEFCYFLQGVFEIADLKSLDETQTQIVKDHLQLVFNKITPDRRHISIEDQIGIPKDGKTSYCCKRNITQEADGYFPLDTPFRGISERIMY